jgi:hypothetical protein
MEKPFSGITKDSSASHICITARIKAVIFCKSAQVFPWHVLINYSIDFDTISSGCRSDYWRNFEHFRYKIKSGFVYLQSVKPYSRWLGEFSFIIDKKSVLKREIISDIRCYYSGKDMKHYSKAALLNFPIPLKGQKNNITLKLNVIKPDLELKKFRDSIKLYVAVSGVP